MPVTRRTLLEHLAATTDARGEATTTVGALATALETDPSMIDPLLAGLARADLVHRYPDGRVRITITGEELLALDADGPVIVDSRE